MNPASPLQLDDEVEIIESGHRFKISQIMKNPDGTLVYSAPMELYYPASSLRKVEELQIGDWAEIVGPSLSGESRIGEKVRVEGRGKIPALHDLEAILNKGELYPASSLRKLTPEEIAQHQKNQLKVSVAMDVSNALAGIEKVQDNLWKIRTEARLSAIEDRQESIDSYITRITNVGAALEKRLAFVEAFQKEQAENAPEHKPLPRADPTLAAMIADGTLEVSDFRKKDLKTQRKIIRGPEEDLANDCTGMTCAECMDEVESDGIRIAALEHAIRWLRMPDMRRDPLHSHEVADVLEGMMEEMEK